MRTLDIVLALLGLLVFCSFLGIIVAFAPDPVLILVCAVCVLMAAFDFARELFAKR